MQRIKTLLAIVMLYITVAGLATFSLFILEESFQTVMFGTWPAQDAQRWDIVKIGLDLMQSTVTTMRWVTYTCGWIQPLAFISYRSYSISAEFYISALRAKCLAHRPDLFEGEIVSLEFRPNTVTVQQDSTILVTAGKIGALVATNPDRPILKLSGILRAKSGFWIINTLEDKP